MRDFSAGRDVNVGGDVVINDNSINYKPLAQCSNEELRFERTHRYELLETERGRKLKVLVRFLMFGGSLLVVAAVWYYIQGKIDIFSLLIGFGGCMISAASFKGFDQPTEFEQRQIFALNEIALLLRERREE